MSDLNAAYDALIKRLIQWAGSEDDIRAVIILGSRAREHPPADEWSDLDVQLLVTDPDRYVETTQWTRTFGNVILTFTELTPDGKTVERRVLYEGGIDVDFVPTDVAEARDALANSTDRGIFVVVDRGYRFIVDKDGIEEEVHAAMARIASPEPPMPDEEEYLNVVSDFWYHTVWLTKKLRRGEIWSAWSGLLGITWDDLLTMLAWHAKAQHGADYDTWHGGRFLEQWTDADAVRALDGATARCSESDVRRALPELMDLFSRGARETADALDFLYPEFAESGVREVVANLLAVDDSRED